MINYPIKNDYKIAIIVSFYHKEITERLLQGAKQALSESGLHAHWVVPVFGAVEIAFAANHIANKHNADGVIVLGAVIFGETDHYKYVSDQVSQGCQQVGLSHDIPVGFGVLTTKNQQQALERSGGLKGNAGYDAALAVINLLSAYECL